MSVTIEELEEKLKKAKMVFESVETMNTISWEEYIYWANIK